MNQLIFDGTYQEYPAYSWSLLQESSLKVVKNLLSPIISEHTICPQKAETFGRLFGEYVTQDQEFAKTKDSHLASVMKKVCFINKNLRYYTKKHYVVLNELNVSPNYSKNLNTLTYYIYITDHFPHYPQLYMNNHFRHKSIKKQHLLRIAAKQVPLMLLIILEPIMSVLNLQNLIEQSGDFTQLLLDIDSNTLKQFIRVLGRTIDLEKTTKKKQIVS